MSFLDRAKHAAEQAARVAAEQGGKAAAGAAATIRDPATKARAQSALKRARKGFTTALERIDPGVLADVVIKATSLQERANARLRDRGSAYRIGEITIGASIPPSIQFSIERIVDPEGQATSSTDLLAAAASTHAGGATATEAIVSLDGTTVDEADLEELAAEA